MAPSVRLDVHCKTKTRCPENVTLTAFWHHYGLHVGLQIEFEPHNGFVVKSLNTLDGLPKANREAAGQVEVGDVIISFNGADLTRDAESARTIIHQQSSDVRVISLKRLASKKLKQHHHKKHSSHKKSDASGISDLLGSMKKKRDKAERKAAEEARKRREELAFLSRPTYSPVQMRLERCLQQDSELAAVHVEVRNESYWYRNRRILGPRRHMFLGTKAKLNYEGIERWHCSIFRATVDDAVERFDCNAEGIHKNNGYDNEIHALMQAEKATRERDQNPAEYPPNSTNRPKPENILASHFKVLVVSREFQGLTYSERNVLTFDALAREYHDSASYPPIDGLRRKKFSYLGSQVRQLPFWRTLGEMAAVNLILELLTPTEWSPGRFQATETDRFGTGRNQNRQLNEDNTFHDREKQIVVNVKRALDHEKHPDPTRHDKQQMPQHHRHKSGGVYGHHYFGLPPKMRHHLVEQIKIENEMIDEFAGRNEGKIEAEEQAKVAFASDGIDPATASAKMNAIVVATFQAMSHRVSHAMVRIQRIWRQRFMWRAQRTSNRRHVATINLQRWIRGYYGRVLYGLYKRVAHMAAGKIQSHFRALMDYRLIQAYKVLVVIAATKVQTLIRGFLAKSFLDWIIRNGIAATVIQRIIRGFLARPLLKILKLNHFAQTRVATVKTNPVVAVQTIIRRFCRIRAYERLIVKDVHEKIRIPASTLLGRVYLGYKGRLKAMQKRIVRDAATMIQKIERGWVKRIWLARVKRYLLEKASQTKISKVFRGHVTREIFRRKKKKHHHLHIEIPSAIFMQRIYRGHLARDRVKNRKQEWLAGMLIQLQFRTLVARKQVRRKWDELVARQRWKAARQIQMAFRGFSSRKYYNECKITEVGRRVYAARVILRSWIRSRDGARFRELKEAWEVEKSAELLMEISEERSEIKEDLADIRADIQDQQNLQKLWEKRLTELDNFQIEAELRMAKVDFELDNIGPEEIQQGWGAAYDNELVSLQNKSALALEEARCLKVKIREIKDKIQDLLLELEDVEQDLDDNDVQEVGEFELLRRMELERADRRARKRFAARVRRQKCRWSIPDVRRNVIARTRLDLARHKEMVQKYEPREILTTLSFEQKKNWLKDETALVKQLEKKARAKAAKTLKDTGERSDTIRNTYDAVIAGCLDVLKTSSFETRRPKNDVRDNEEVQERLWPKEMRVLRQEDENRRRHREFVVKGEGQLDADQLSHIK